MNALSVGKGPAQRVLKTPRHRAMDGVGAARQAQRGRARGAGPVAGKQHQMTILCQICVRR